MSGAIGGLGTLVLSLFNSKDSDSSVTSSLLSTIYGTGAGAAASSNPIAALDSAEANSTKDIAQTAKQLVEVSNGHAVLHSATIRDWPALRYRGLDDDLSRGPVPTRMRS